jgi:hypothetical protein
VYGGRCWDAAPVTKYTGVLAAAVATREPGLRGAVGVAVNV